MIKNSQPFGKKCQKAAGGIFFYSHCRLVTSAIGGRSMVVDLTST